MTASHLIIDSSYEKNGYTSFGVISGSCGVGSESCEGTCHLRQKETIIGRHDRRAKVRGDSLNWYYKGVGTGKETQMRCYSPEKTSDATVKVRSEWPTFSETSI